MPILWFEHSREFNQLTKKMMQLEDVQMKAMNDRIAIEK